jgi:hypothetical protein
MFHAANKSDWKKWDGTMRGSEPTKPGYAKSLGFDTADTPVLRGGGSLSPLTTRLLRFIMHAVLSASCIVWPDTLRSEVFDLLSGTNIKGGEDAALGWCVEMMNADWECLRGLTGQTDETLAVLVHLVLHKYSAHIMQHDHSLSSEMGRDAFEQRVHNVCVEPLLVNMERQLAQELSSWESEEQALLGAALPVVPRAACFGSDLYQRVIAEDASCLAISNQPLDFKYLWQPHASVSFMDFRHQLVEMDQANSVLYPFLSDVLAHEKVYSSIKYLPDILEWHQVLFEVFPNNTLSRVDGKRLRVADVIDRISESSHAGSDAEALDRMRGHARDVFGVFTTSFNKVFPMVEQFMCQPNPYHPTHSNTPLRMGENTALIWSLPSKAPDPGGLSDFAETYCTPAVVEWSEMMHNELLSKDWGVVADRNQTKLQLHHRTPIGTLRRSLINYDRDRDLMPLLAIFSGQGKRRRTYSLRHIESVLKRKLLQGRSLIDARSALTSVPYAFKGEADVAVSAGNNNPAEALALDMEQTDLDPSILNDISDELNTREWAQRVSGSTSRLVSSL